MMKQYVTIAGVLQLLVMTGLATAEDRPTFVPANDAVRSIELAGEPETYEIAASDGTTELTVSARCSTQRLRQSDITLGWDLPSASAGAIRVDITGYSEGFRTGRYVTSGPRPGALRTLTFEDGEAGVYYYWRLLTRTAEGWRVRANGRFEAPTCPRGPVDESPERESQ